MSRPLVLVVLHARAFFVSLPISLSIAESKVSGPSPFSNTTSENHFRDSGISSGKPLHITTGNFAQWPVRAIHIGPLRLLCCWHTAFRRSHRRSPQIFVRHCSLQLPHLRVGRRYGRREGPPCGRTSFEGLRVRPERTRSTQRLALLPGRDGPGSGDERG